MALGKSQDAFIETPSEQDKGYDIRLDPEPLAHWRGGRDGKIKQS